MSSKQTTPAVEEKKPFPWLWVIVGGIIFFSMAWKK